MITVITITAEQPVAWVRFCSDGGIEGPILDRDSRMDSVRRTSGAWKPLYIAPQLPRDVLMRLATKIADEAYHRGALGSLFVDTQIADRVDTFQSQTQQSVTDIELVLTAENQKRQEVEKHRDQLQATIGQIADELALEDHERGGDQVLAALMRMKATKAVPLSVPESLELEVFSNSHDEGYVNGWNACRAELLATAQVQPAVAVPPDAFELLHIWQTWLGASREQCDDTGKQLWDRIEAAIAVQPASVLPMAALSKHASLIHYPEHWDTAAYPTLNDAVREVLGSIGCSECKQPVAVPDERAAFEVWGDGKGLDLEREGESYYETDTHFAWEAWADRAMLSAAQKDPRQAFVEHHLGKPFAVSTDVAVPDVKDKYSYWPELATVKLQWAADSTTGWGRRGEDGKIRPIYGDDTREPLDMRYWSIVAERQGPATQNQEES